MIDTDEMISIIIPTFGRTNYLIRAIESVLNQTYSNFEIIIVDDNGESSENQIRTYEKIKDILKKDSRVKYIIHKKNLNGSAARNTGISIAKGEYICFLDDDDEFNREKIFKQFYKLQSLNNDWVACYTGHIRSFGKGNRKNVEYLATNEGNILYDILAFNIDHVSGSSLMVRKEVIDKINGWNEKLNRHQDYEFIAKIASEGKIAVISEPLVTIHVHEGSGRERRFNDIEKTRLNYIYHVENLIAELPTREASYLIYLNNYWLLKKALQYGKLKKAFYYFNKCGKPFQTSAKLIRDTIQFIKKQF